jgi:serine/threonine-protein kinase
MAATPPAFYGSFRYNLNQYQIGIPLNAGFRFVHEPIHMSIRHRFVGRVAETEELVQRLQFSDGGSFLITGYRGVGKTSFVNQVIATLEQRVAVLPVQINLSRPLQPAELMHLIIRCIYERLVEKNWYGQVGEKIQAELTLAYQRTSANVVRKLSDKWERSFELGEAKLPGLKLPFTPKLGGKRSRNIDLETSFLAYDDKAAEHDVIAISLALTQGIEAPMTKWQKLWHRVRGSQAPRMPMKIVFVFDEMDKLDDSASADEQERSAVDEMLASLKNLFTTSGICFLFVAGKDLHDRWLKDLWRGDSIYESVFSYDKYLPCMWSDVDDLCGQLALLDGAPASLGTDLAHAQLVFTNFKHYLRFKGRGIPRRILRAFNELVVWHERLPLLAFTNEDLRRVTFYAQLNQTLEANSERLFGRSAEDVAGTRQDRRRLGVYYVVDWILRQGKIEFTVSDLLHASRHLSSRIALAEEIAGGAISELLGVLTAADYIEQVGEKLDEVALGRAQSDAEPRYRLTARRLAEMAGLATVFEEEAARLYDTVAQTGPGSKIGPYELQELLGQGGMGAVYRAWDTAHNRFVALKVVHERLAYDFGARERFRRELGVLEKLRHDNIVPFFDSGEAGTRIFLAMDLIDGADLRAVIDRQGPLDVNTAVAVLLPIAGAIQFGHEQGFYRFDVKPNNIRISTAGHVYLMDLGIARNVVDDNALTQTGAVVGTPFYMSPEQCRGEDVDKRSDIYSFGAVLYETLTGRPPFTGESTFNVLMHHVNDPPPPPSSFANIPDGLESAILRCLEKDREQRYQTMAEVAAALKPWVAGGTPADLAGLIRVTQQEVQRKEQRLNAATMVFAEEPGPVPAASVVGSAPGFIPAPPAYETPPAHAPSLPAAGAGPRLELFLPDGGTQMYPLIDGETRIGRAPDSDIALHDQDGVSRYHAMIRRSPEGFTLVDMNTRNGSYVNGIRVLEPTPLADLDEVQIGGARFRFHAQ